VHVVGLCCIILTNVASVGTNCDITSGDKCNVLDFLGLIFKFHW